MTQGGKAAAGPVRHADHADHADHGAHAGHVGHDGHAMPAASQSTARGIYPGFSPDEPTPSERAHVPPPPPASELPPIGMREMIQMMGMDDAARHSMLLVDQLEWRNVPQGGRVFWDARYWYGGDYHKLLIKTEGSRRGGDNEGSVELLWDRVIGRWWNMQVGVAHDFGQPRERTWLTAGISGLSPYWFDVSALVYVGEEGRSALRLSGEYELLFSQRLILQTHAELTAYGKDDPENALGSGLSSAGAGLRLRYEIRREIAPYIGVTRHWRFSRTARMAEQQGAERADWQWLAGVRIWF